MLSPYRCACRASVATRMITIRTRRIELHAWALELPLLVRSGPFSFFFSGLEVGLRGSVFAVRSPHYPREGISEVWARDS